MKEKTKLQSYFSVELFSMAFALLCVLSFVCLVTGDMLFGEIGLIVRSFLLGVFGYVSFPLLVAGTYFGIKGVIGFKVKHESLKALFVYAVFYAFFILIIVQTIFDRPSGNFSQYIDYCYRSGASFSTVTPGGVLFALPVYPLSVFITPVGTYVFCGVALIGITVFLFRTPITAYFAGAGDRKEERREKKEEKKRKKVIAAAKKANVKVAENTDGKADVSETDNEFSSSDLSGNGSSGNILGVSGDFELKSEKDKKNKEKERSLKLLFGEDRPSGLGGGRTSYGESYDRELAEKTEYIRKPYDIRGIKVESPTGDTGRKVRYDDDDEDMDIDVSVPDKDVYVIRNDRDRSADRIRSFDDASGRTGREDETDDYNRDRFVRPERRTDYSDGTSRSRSFDSDRNYPDDTTENYRGVSSIDTSDNDERDNYGREASSRVSAAANRSAAARYSRPVIEDIPDNEEGNTPNAEVLRKLSRAERDKRSSARGDSSLRNDFSSKNAYGGYDLNDDISDVRPSFNDTGRSSTQNVGLNEETTGINRRSQETDDYAGYNRAATDRTTYGGSNARGSYGGTDKNSDVEVERITPAENMHSSEDPQSRNSFGGESPRNNEYRSEQPAETKPAEESVKAAPVKSGSQTNMLGDEETKENPIAHIPKGYRFNFPPLSLLKDYLPDAKLQARITKEQNARRETILQILNNPDIQAEIVDITVGPSLTRFEITIPPRIQMRKVMEKYDDLNLWMEAKSRIRIIAPIPGTSRIGLEVPNSVLAPVGLKEVMSSDEFRNAKKNSISFALGKDMVGKPLVSDISKMPHLLVAGATGTGKSVFLNTLLISLMYKYSPEELRLVLVDPKLVEFSVYRGIPELLFGEIFTEEKEASAMLDWMVEEMGRRYNAFRDAMVRDIDEYNAYVTATKGKKMFRILILIDEFADLMAVSDKKHMDVAIGRLAAKARSAGIHIILATQRPTTDIVDGSIKTNFPSRIVFKMSSATDAMVVMGEAGAEKLLGDGDMFYKVGKMTNVERAQGAFIVAKEVNDVCNYVRENNKNYYDEIALEEIRKMGEENEAAAAAESGEFTASDEEGGPKGGGVEESFIKSAMRIAIQGGTVSISLLQRKLSVGFPKAGKIVDTLEARGYISPVGDNNKRKILMSAEQFEQTFGEPL